MSLRPSEEPYTTIASLRAEVERLQASQTFGYWRTRANRLEQQIEVLEHERDEALEREKEQSKALAILGDELTASQRETDEALAQVAVLLQRLQEEHCLSESCDLHTEPYAEARALLYRLQDAEADAVAFATQLTQVKDRLQRAEAMIEELRATLENAEPGFLTRSMCLLAAWEDGKT